MDMILFLLDSLPVAQLDRALDYESRGRKFESCRAGHFYLHNAPVAQVDRAAVS